MEKLIQQLQKFKTLEPKSEFKDRSRVLILNSPQNHPPAISIASFLFSRYQFALLAALFLLLAASLSYFGGQKPALASLDQNSLEDEVESFDFDIKLSQAEYYADSVKQMEVALKATAGELAPPESQEIDELLEKLTL